MAEASLGGDQPGLGRWGRGKWDMAGGTLLTWGLGRMSVEAEGEAGRWCEWRSTTRTTPEKASLYFNSQDFFGEQSVSGWRVFGADAKSSLEMASQRMGERGNKTSTIGIEVTQGVKIFDSNMHNKL